MRPAPPAGTKRPFVPRAVLAAPGFPWASRRWPVASAPARRGGAGINHGSSRARRHRRKRPGCAKAFAGRILAHATRPRICEIFAGRGEIAPPQLTLRFRNNCRAPRILSLLSPGARTPPPTDFPHVATAGTARKGDPEPNLQLVHKGRLCGHPFSGRPPSLFSFPDSWHRAMPLDYGSNRPRFPPRLSWLRLVAVGIPFHS